MFKFIPFIYVLFTLLSFVCHKAINIGRPAITELTTKWKSNLTSSLTITLHRISFCLFFFFVIHIFYQFLTLIFNAIVSQYILRHFFNTRRELILVVLSIIDTERTIFFYEIWYIMKVNLNKFAYWILVEN